MDFTHLLVLQQVKLIFILSDFLRTVNCRKRARRDTK